MTQRNMAAMNDIDTCTVCSDKYTKIIRKKIECKYCHQSTCSKCIEQYLLGRHEDAHCLHCRVNYNDATLYEICTKTYLTNSYFKHRQDVLVNREKANLPGMQIVEIEERKRREKVEKIAQLNTEIQEFKVLRADVIIEYSRLCNLHYELVKAGNPSSYADKCDELKGISENYRTLINEKQHAIRLLRYNHDTNEEKEMENEKKKFIRRCTRDGCQGFLSTAWKCGICEWNSCSKCFAVKGKEHDAEHECKKEDVETAELIKTDSKPCPNCGEFIMKSSGCDQMFCISCQTPFSWNTGKIVTSGPIHNPHYYEWMKRNGSAMPRNPADVPCGGFPTVWELRKFQRGADSKLINSFYEFHRICQEIQDISMQYRSHMDVTLTNQINIKFLLGDFDEKQWGRLLAGNEKKRKRDAEIQEIFAAFRMVAVDIINQVQQHPTMSRMTHIEVDTFLKELNVQIHGLIKMLYDAMKTLSITYSYTVPYIDILQYDTQTGMKYNSSVFYKVSHKKFTKYDKSDIISEVTESTEDSKEENLIHSYTNIINSVQNNSVQNTVNSDDDNEDIQTALQESVRGFVNTVKSVMRMFDASKP